VALAFAAALTLAAAAHTTAAAAQAEGCTGATFRQAVAHASGAIVGTISKTGENDAGVTYASEVEVERALGTQAGAIWHGTAYPGYCWCCGDDRPKVGARVVVLVNVTVINPGTTSDAVYTVGVTVTQAQVSRLANDLPDTAAATEAAPATPAPSATPAVLLAAFVIAGTLLLVMPRQHGPRPK
jgi:hypothetical protein